MTYLAKPWTVGLLTFLGLLLNVSCSAGGTRNTDLVIYAASSLTEPFQEIAATFEMENPGVRVALNFNGSQRLSTQLTHGARADLFASADWLQMDTVAGTGLVIGAPVNFASNSLIMIAWIGATQSPTLDYLAQHGTKVVLAQENVPVGNYSRQVLRNLQGDANLGPDYSDRVLSNLVSEESNVRNVAQKVALGEADAGIVYRTDASSRDIRERVVVVNIPESMNVTADYPIAIMQNAQEKVLAQKFVDFLLSSEGQDALQRHGFGRASKAQIATLIPSGTGR